MSNMADGKKSLVTLSVRMPKWLEGKIKKACHEDCRALAEELAYLLEVMLAVLYRQPRFFLGQHFGERLLDTSGHLKVKISPELYNALFHKAGEYGLNLSELARILWAIALDFRDRLDAGKQLLRKEDFIKLILETAQQKTVH